MKRVGQFPRLIFTAALLLAPALLRADEDSSDPRAEQLVAEMIAAYQHLPAYSDQGTFGITIATDGKSTSQTFPLQLQLVRPNKLRINAGLAQIVSDGTTLTMQADPLKKYASAPAPSRITYDTVFTGGPIGSLLFGGPGGPMMQVLVSLLVGSDPARSLSDLGKTVRLGDDRVVGDAPCKVVRISSKDRPTFVLQIEPGSKLLRAIDLEWNEDVLKDLFPKGRKVEIGAFRWLSGAITTKDPGENAFTFQPPAEFSKVDSLASAGPNEKAQPADEPRLKVFALVGKPAPDCMLTLLEPEGKSRTIRLKELAGKVVVVDFWATWCGPCLRELPLIQKTIEHYAAAGKDVVVVALSQDDDPRDPVEVRKLVEKTLDENKITLSGSAVGRIGIDPNGKVGQAFEIEGFPTLVVIDSRGVVQAAHVGAEDDIDKTLTTEIDALLAGKSLSKSDK